MDGVSAAGTEQGEQGSIISDGRASCSENHAHICFQVLRMSGQQIEFPQTGTYCYADRNDTVADVLELVADTL